MTSAIVAALIATFALGFVEALGRFYPSVDTWWRLRRTRGRRAVRTMRQRFESAADRRTPRVLATILLALVVAWVAGASLLDKRWYEVVFDVLPYAIVGAALMRMPRVLRAIAERMRSYERLAGDDPDSDAGDGRAAIAL